MSASNAKKAAPALAGSHPRNSVMLGGATDQADSTALAALQAVRRSAWRRIRSAIDEQAEALHQRFDLQDHADIPLRADARTFEELAHALCDLWESGRAA